MGALGSHCLLTRVEPLMNHFLRTQSLVSCAQSCVCSRCSFSVDWKRKHLLAKVVGQSFPFPFCCEQVALCGVSVPAAGPPAAAPDGGGAPARRLDHHAYFRRVGGPVPAEGRRGSSRAPRGVWGKAEPCRPVGRVGALTSGPSWSQLSAFVAGSRASGAGS